MSDLVIINVQSGDVGGGVPLCLSYSLYKSNNGLEIGQHMSQ